MDDAQQQEMLPPAGDIAQLAESLFRREAGKLVAVMTRIFGVARLQMAEDVVQEALVRALRTWPYYGVPRNPAAWIMQTAKHLAVDVIRRETIFNGKQPDIAAAMTPPQPDADVDEAPLFDSEIKDDRLRMMFACCHPAIPPESQAALALKTLCGFSTAEIAGAFLTSEAAAARRLTRARQKLNELCIPFEIPSGEALAARLDAVLQTLYLLFNEGYKACRGENLDPATRNALVRARIEGAARTPAPGSSVRVRVPVGQPRNAVAVPVSALRKGPEGDHVFVIAPDTHGEPRAHRRKVQSGTLLGDEIAVYAGLAAGERIAVSGSFKLRENTLVAIADDRRTGQSEAFHGNIQRTSATQ